MAKKLFLLDGMALVYRAHFALVARPIYTSKGVNTSALYGFTQTLLDIINKQQPTHLAVAFDTEAPTERHVVFPDYKIQREAMPEDLSAALPHVRRLLEAFNIPVLICDGYEADDIIGTLVCAAVKEDFTTYMVTPDKDFGQLVSERTFLYKPSRMGDGVEILGMPEILAKWGIDRVEQVIDILALWGDTSDNIPGVPGIGEKTASKLIRQYGSVENLLAHTHELKGKLRESLETHRDNALLSKRLATINCQTPCLLGLETLRLRERNDELLKPLFEEFEFNTIGRRLFGDSFRALGGAPTAASPPAPAAATQPEITVPEPEVELPREKLSDHKTNYQSAGTPAEQEQLREKLKSLAAVGLTALVEGNDPREARVTGLGFSWKSGEAIHVPLRNAAELTDWAEVFSNPKLMKVGHDLKFLASLLRWVGITLQGRLFDAQLAHSLLEPDRKHGLPQLAATVLGLELSDAPEAGPVQRELSLDAEDESHAARRACEQADVVWRLREKLEPQLRERGQERVYYEIEAPLLPVLVAMEFEGVRVDAAALEEFGRHLADRMATAEKSICGLAGSTFNINSPRQLGEVLFDVLKICEKPKKTRTGQYATDEQTLLTLAPENQVVQSLLEYRTMSKLKSTYADTLPTAIYSKTGRIHTTYNQAATSTGRLNSQNPNLQNIPIRTEQGQEIRRAFVARGDEFLLLSADYSQIELRIIAALSKETGLLDAFRRNLDVHTATAAHVFGVSLEEVSPEMRRKAKMVNYGIAYGISAFGLAQRLAIPRKEASAIIDQYFAQFAGVRRYMSDTLEFARANGYVETVTGRRRYIRDIRSSNATVRGSAERNAINAPIQGTAADMIKIAMVQLQAELEERQYRTRMLLQVHDELVFDLHREERDVVLPLVEEKMKHAITLDVPIEVELGVGANWLEAH